MLTVFYTSLIFSLSLVLLLLLLLPLPPFTAILLFLHVFPSFPFLFSAKCSPHTTSTKFCSPTYRLTFIHTTKYATETILVLVHLFWYILHTYSYCGLVGTHTYQTTRWYCPQDHSINIRSPENLNPHPPYLQKFELDYSISVFSKFP